MRYLLANPLYAGYIKHYASGELYPVQGDAFPPIVGEQTWRAAVSKLEDNVRRSARQGNQVTSLCRIRILGRITANHSRDLRHTLSLAAHRYTF